MKLVRVGMSMQEAVIAKVNKVAGDSFKKGDPIYEIETEKVTQEIEADADGHVVEVFVKEGDTVPVGAPICVVVFSLERHDI